MGTLIALLFGRDLRRVYPPTGVLRGDVWRKRDVDAQNDGLAARDV